MFLYLILIIFVLCKKIIYKTTIIKMDAVNKETQFDFFKLWVTIVLALFFTFGTTGIVIYYKFFNNE